MILMLPRFADNEIDTDKMFNKTQNFPSRFFDKRLSTYLYLDRSIVQYLVYKEEIGKSN